MDVYFQQLNQTLKNHSRALPFLLVDMDKLDKNIQTLKQQLNPSAELRIVVKSLPCIELIAYTMKHLSTHNLMVFHQPFLTDLAGRLDEHADILLGKPMPIKTATYFYENLPKNNPSFNPYQQINWLVDTNDRIQTYINLAKKLNQRLQLNLEIDVGLHRGGFNILSSLRVALQLILDNQQYVQLTGLMGYDPHVVKLPKIIRSAEKALQLANTFYSECKQIIEQDFPDLWHNDLTFNGAGSPTIKLHNTNASPLNDIAAGSCLVKPTTFDISTLNDYQPACYIATPVLKKFSNTTIPAMENMKGLLNLTNSKNKKSYFIYGGYWKADYCYPKGIKQNTLFGNSTNQTMLNAPADTTLEVDDFVFLRPHQSEFVMLQFGHILAIRNGQIEAEWELLNNC